MQLALGAVLQAVKGWRAPETGRGLWPRRELWEELGPPRSSFKFPMGIDDHMHRGELDLARRLDQDLLQSQPATRRCAGSFWVTHASVEPCCIAGRFASSRSHLEKALAIYDPISHSALSSASEFMTRGSAQGNLGVVSSSVSVFPTRH